MTLATLVRGRWRVTARTLAPGAAAAVALTLAGCGGGVTRQQVIERGNAICGGALRQIRSLPAPSGTLPGLAAYLGHVVPIVQHQAAQLKALPRPAQQRAVLERYIAAAQADAAQYAQLAAAARAGDSGAVNQALANLRTSPAGALAAQYGLTQCAAPAGTGVS